MHNVFTFIAHSDRRAGALCATYWLTSTNNRASLSREVLASSIDPLQPSSAAVFNDSFTYKCRSLSLVGRKLVAHAPDIHGSPILAARNVRLVGVVRKYQGCSTSVGRSFSPAPSAKSLPPDRMALNVLPYLTDLSHAHFKSPIPQA